MTADCDCCALRNLHTYRMGCQRCEARAFARGPRETVDAHLHSTRYSAAFRALVDEERQRDQVAGIAA